MRTLVIGDIHGGVKAVKQVLERASVTSNDFLIFLGDYVDGWSESSKVIDFLIALQSTHNCIFLLGNHDELLLEWLVTKEENLMWLQNGGHATVTEYKKLSSNKIKQHINFIQSLPTFYLDDQNRLFLHAGFTSYKGIEYEYYKKLFYWDRTLWETALALDPNLSQEDVLYPKRFKLYKEIYIGHTPVTQINETVPINKACVWNLDTGAAFKGKLTIMDIDTKEFWQSDPLPKLYPNETGRN
jgi:serine/threonine protein phosphatase 1